MSTSSDIKAGKYRIFANKFYGGCLRTFIYSILTALDVKVGKDSILKKFLNASYQRTFIYSVLNSFEVISAN